MNTITYSIKLTRKQFLELPLRLRRKMMKRQCDLFLYRKALNALALALVRHKHKWTDQEREYYDTAVGDN